MEQHLCVGRAGDVCACPHAAEASPGPNPLNLQRGEQGAHDICDRVDEDLAVPDLACLRRLDDYAAHCVDLRPATTHSKQSADSGRTGRLLEPEPTFLHAGACLAQGWCSSDMEEAAFTTMP